MNRSTALLMGLALSEGREERDPYLPPGIGVPPGPSPEDAMRLQTRPLVVSLEKVVMHAGVELVGFVDADQRQFPACQAFIAVLNDDKNIDRVAGITARLPSGLGMDLAKTQRELKNFLEGPLRTDYALSAIALLASLALGLRCIIFELAAEAARNYKDQMAEIDRL